MPDHDALRRRNARELTSLLDRDEVSAREITESCLERIVAVNPGTNAIIELRPRESLAAADAADTARRRGDRTTLRGIPVVTEITTEQAGCSADEGVTARADRRAAGAAPVVRALRAAGGTLTGRNPVWGCQGRAVDPSPRPSAARVPTPECP